MRLSVLLTRLSVLLLGLLIFNPVGTAQATQIISLVGDKDGFGLTGAPAVPPDGTLWIDDLGGVFWTDYRDAGDLANAPFTDIWFSGVAVTYSHTYSLGGLIPVSASLAVQMAGVADDRGPWDVFLNGALLGEIPKNTSVNADQEIFLYTFPVSAAILTESDTALLNINIPDLTDGYSINFSELTIEAVVPEPSTGLSLAAGLAAIAMGRRGARVARAGRPGASRHR